MFALFALATGVATFVMCLLMALAIVLHLFEGKALVDDPTRAMSFATMAFAFAAIAFHFLA